jgi:hypothetical protein
MTKGLRSLKPRLKSLLIRASSLLAAFAVLTVILNLPWFDEALDPAVAAALERAPVSMHDNAYAYMRGFKVAAGSDPMAAGQAFVNDLRDMYYRGERLWISTDEWLSAYGEPISEDEWRSDLPGVRCDRRRTTDCADRLIRDISQAQPMGPHLELLLERYETLLRLPRFEAMAENSAYFGSPLSFELLSIGRIRLALSYINDTPQRFLERVREEIGFWSRVLHGGRDIGTGNAAAVQLHLAMEFLSVFIRTGDPSQEELDSAQLILRSLLKEDWDLRRFGLTEFGNNIRYIEASAESWSEFRRSAGRYLGQPAIALISQRNASLNDYFEFSVEPRLALAELSAAEYYEHRRQQQPPLMFVEFWEQRQRASIKQPPPALFLYNLGGKFLRHRYSSLEGALPTLIMQIHDSKGGVILGLLQIETASAPESDVRGSVEASRYRNPYTSEPMEYDEVTGLISFACLIQWSEQICSVAIGTNSI